MPRTALNGRPRTSQIVWERGRVDRGAGTAAPDGPKWTAQSDDQWWVWGGGEVVKGCKGVRLISLKTALNGRPRAMKRLEGVWEGSREGDDGKHS